MRRWYRRLGDAPAGGKTCGPNRQIRGCRSAAKLARAGFAWVICVETTKPCLRTGFQRGFEGPVAVISFRSKYIVVAVIAAVVVSLAVGSVLVLENRTQHAALLNTATADARDRVLRELKLRSDELAQRVAERVDDAVLLSNRDEIGTQLEDFKRDATLLGVVVRDAGGNELYAWRRPGHVAGSMTRS